MNQALSSLYDSILKHLDQEELRTLCFKRGIQYDELRGEGHGGKVRELLQLTQRRNQVDHLLDTLCQTHPEVDWRQTAQGSAAPTIPHALTPRSPPKPFIGRKDERRQLAQALRDERGSVHILQGLGGVGKTALAANWRKTWLTISLAAYCGSRWRPVPGPKRCGRKSPPPTDAPPAPRTPPPPPAPPWTDTRLC